jgi:polysaccharide biosynthesis/export protein
LRRKCQTLLHIGYSVLAIALIGCVGPSSNYPQAENHEPPANLSARSDAAQVATESEDVQQNDSSSLEQVYESRTADNSAASSSTQSFTLGPGDLLRISVPAIDELKDRTVRVSAHDTIALPMLGSIDVRGMTEDDLREDLSHRLKKYMHFPQVEVFLLRTENREVAVLGSVSKPGRYTLSSHDDSIMILISRAGGVTKEAASRLIFVPAQANSAKTAEVSPPGQSSPSDSSPGSTSGKLLQASLTPTTGPGKIANRPEEQQFLISLSDIRDQRYLDIPVEPGDVIIVPAAGQVTVQGWVEKPGAYPISPGLTVLGSIAAAGGADFTSSATLLREENDGSKVSIPLNLSKIKRGKEADLPVQAGDVIIAERSAIGAVPYSLYFLVNRLGLGGGYYFY